MTSATEWLQMLDVRSSWKTWLEETASVELLGVVNEVVRTYSDRDWNLQGDEDHEWIRFRELCPEDRRQTEREVHRFE